MKELAHLDQNMSKLVSAPCSGGEGALSHYHISHLGGSLIARGVELRVERTSKLSDVTGGPNEFHLRIISTPWQIRSQLSFQFPFEVIDSQKLRVQALF